MKCYACPNEAIVTCNMCRRGACEKHSIDGKVPGDPFKYVCLEHAEVLDQQAAGKEAAQRQHQLEQETAARLEQLKQERIAELMKSEPTIRKAFEDLVDRLKCSECNGSGTARQSVHTSTRQRISDLLSGGGVEIDTEASMAGGSDVLRKSGRPTYEHVKCPSCATIYSQGTGLSVSAEQAERMAEDFATQHSTSEISVHTRISPTSQLYSASESISFDHTPEVDEN